MVSSILECPGYKGLNVLVFGHLMMTNPLLDFECLQTITTCEDLSNKTFKLWKHSNYRLILVRQANGDCNSKSRHYFCYSTARKTQLLVSNLNGK